MSLNKLIKPCGIVSDSQLGILDTPMFPCQYYGGFIHKWADGWWPTDNGTGYFRTLQEAEERVERLKGGHVDSVADQIRTHALNALGIPN